MTWAWASPSFSCLRFAELLECTHLCFPLNLGAFSCYCFRAFLQRHALSFPSDPVMQTSSSLVPSRTPGSSVRFARPPPSCHRGWVVCIALLLPPSFLLSIPILSPPGEFFISVVVMFLNSNFHLAVTSVPVPILSRTSGFPHEAGITAALKSLLTPVVTCEWASLDNFFP